VNGTVNLPTGSGKAAKAAFLKEAFGLSLDRTLALPSEADSFSCRKAPISGCRKPKRRRQTVPDQTTNETGSKSSKPPYLAYAVIDRGDDKKSKWREIGVAFPHKDGKGFDILYDVQPLNGRITLRVPESK
jgi:hypothetical protein